MKIPLRYHFSARFPFRELVLGGFTALVLLTGIKSAQGDQGIKGISLPVIPDLQRADLYVLKQTLHPKGVLILTPGFNEDGQDWLQKPRWQEFARTHDLALVGLSFASDGDLLRRGRGYYYPDQGSGPLLLNYIDRTFGGKLPLLLFGFSGGAHFTSGFAAWKPERVLAWCAYSAEWWEKPASNKFSPPGLIACGDQDERYGASLLFFKQGRALGKPWLWIDAPSTGHWISSQVEDFSRDYFAAQLEPRKTRVSGQWIDIDLKTNAASETLSYQPSLTGWLPDKNLLSEWKSVDQL